MWFLVVIFLGWIFWEIIKTVKKTEKEKNDNYKKSRGIDTSPTHLWCETEEHTIVNDEIVGIFEKMEKLFGGIEYYFRLTIDHGFYTKEENGGLKPYGEHWKIGERVRIWAPGKSRKDVLPTNLVELMKKVKIGTEVKIGYIGLGLGYRRKDDSYGDFLTSAKSSLLLLNKNKLRKIDPKGIVYAIEIYLKNDRANPNSKSKFVKYYKLFEIFKHDNVNDKWIRVGRDFKKYVLPPPKSHDWNPDMGDIVRKMTNTVEWRQRYGI